MAPADRYRPVRIWLMFVALMVCVMVLVGGATRLTESGLSITEWKPVTGALPPMSDQAWNDEFAKYQQIPQYQQINKGMSLGDFKKIYFWEWLHRLLGRVIGLVFIVPLAVFWWRGNLDRSLAPKLFLLFLLGGLQGAIGWWMVASGLTERTSVAPYRLAVHLTLAFFLFAAILWTALSLKPRNLPVRPAIKAAAWGLLVLSFVQVFLGAIVAGLDAGLSFTTWPLMDGMLIPSAASLSPLEPLWRNLFENPMTAQFVHRMTAYLLLAAAVANLVLTRGTPAFRPSAVLLLTIVIQAVIGVLTLIHVVPLGLALLHQFGALAVIAHAASNVQRFSTQAQVAVPSAVLQRA
ncbi:COX15/CtaA family protein [Terrihabitans rhizophilus]|uniref:Heme A synthase n=1 Tax=Terrihabitans rhizophilus TaxID=3092662 RepID=A0ABU4RTT8_9HYPH|nr:COX15/CtaA family protein [Terrihabitans sp. PJ23]MDX6807085.1 COX15/CtaA family protein [Terrihabitans sp. PJ23]